MEMLRQEMEHRLSVWFRKTDQMLRRKIERRVKKTGVYSGQHRILMHLNLRPNCSQAELAEWMEISPAAIAVSIKKLEKGGYIQRRPDAADNRALQVIISPKGKAVIEQSIDIFQKVDEEMFAGFSEAELQQLEVFLERMYRNLEDKKKMEEI